MGDELRVDSLFFYIPDRAGGVDAACADQVETVVVPIEGGERG